MDIVKFKKQVQQGKLDHFYVFTGDEIGLQNIYLNQLSNVKRVDTVLEVWSKLKSSNKLFKQGAEHVYVVRDDKDFMSKDNILELISNIKHNTLILQVTKLDKKTKFYKAIKDYVIEFNTMTTKQLLPTIMNLMPVKNSKMTTEFIEACNNDYGTIMSELDKVKYGGVEVIEDVIENARNYSSFTFIDLLYEHNIGAVKYLINLLENGESELGILTLIHNRAAELLQLIHGILPEGKNEWACKKNLKNNRLNEQQLYRAQRWSKIYIEGIKNGDYQAYDAVLLCTMKILN